MEHKIIMNNDELEIKLEFDHSFLIKCFEAVDVVGIKTASRVAEKFCEDPLKAIRRCHYVSNFLFFPWIKDCSIIVELCYLYGGRKVFAAIKLFQGDYIGSELNLCLYNNQVEKAKKKFRL
jgi:hypothetical protein